MGTRGKSICVRRSKERQTQSAIRIPAAIGQHQIAGLAFLWGSSAAVLQSRLIASR